jgi:hypothetical protein
MKFFLDKVITLRRLKMIDTNRSSYSATGTAEGYSASVQEPSPDKQQMYGGQIGNLWECYVEDCPALDGDQVVINGETYSVQNIKVMDFGIQHYTRLTIVKNAD